MVVSSGGNIKKVKLQNQNLILKLIASYNGISRIDLAQKTGLSKMAISNLVADLISTNLVCETETPPAAPETSLKPGRNPISLCISPTSPCICGISIKRGRWQIVLGDLAGQIFDRESLTTFSNVSQDTLIMFIKEGFTKLRKRTKRNILAVGISSIGPVNSQQGVVLNPPSFYNIENLPLADIVQQYTQLPTFLYNDGNAGALAELVYGLGKNIPNFAYIHIMHGIGSGYVLEGKVYNGDCGQSGEIGHSTINFSGPKCSCGNTGCLELYANIETVRKYINDAARFFPASRLRQIPTPSLLDVVDAANKGDPLAIAALEEYLSYVAHAMTNILNFLDLSHIIVDYRSTSKGTILEDILFQRITSSVHHFQTKNINMLRSNYSGDAPLVGAIALIASKIFNNELSI